MLEYIRKLIIVKTFEYTIRTHEQKITSLDIIQKYDISLCRTVRPLDSPYDHIPLWVMCNLFMGDFPNFTNELTNE